MSSDDSIKICPSCKLRDKTSFSKCRGCGTRYDARIEEPSGGGRGFDQTVFLIMLGLFGALGAYQWNASEVKERRTKEIAPLVKQIKAANRPRVIVFYADWCGPCRNYEPVVTSLKAKYAGKVDVDRVNIESSSTLPRTFNVHAIPRTVTLDRQGNQIDSIAGDIGEAKLDEMMQHLTLLR